jgi:outer membrane PBP1 activator LpoA protein
MRILVLLVLALVLAGCGGGGGNDEAAKQAYETKLKSEGSRLKTAFSAADIGEAENFKALARALEHLQTELDRTARDLDALDAPKDAAADDAKLAVLYRKAAAKVGQMANAARGDHEQRLHDLNEQLDDIMAQARIVTGDLKAKGYEIGVLGEH